MKLTIVLFFLATIQVSASAFAQNKVIDVNVTNVSLSDLFWKLQEDYNIVFVYKTDDIKELTSVTVNKKNTSLDKILDEIFKNTSLIYEFNDDVVVISKIQAGQQKTDKVRIKGKVSDVNKNPIEGVTVLLKGTYTGVSTNAKGEYSIDILKNDNNVLVFSFVGMKSKEVSLGNKVEVNVVLEEDVSELEDVVVTGIFNKSRESYTGSVSTINKEQLKVFRGQNLLQTLGNIDPSLNIRVNNDQGSNPNAIPELTIRGNSSLPTSINELNSTASRSLNTPLVIMDGFEITLQKLMDFNDEEIESINILKDASATAIYGSRGANGVIVITTRSPQAGKLKFYVSGSLDVEVPDLSSYNLMNAAEKLELERLAGLFDSDSPSSDIELKKVYNEILKDVVSGVDTYWLEKPLREGYGGKVNVRVEGGSEEFRWSAALGNNSVIGVMKGSSRNVTDASVTLQYKYKGVIFKNQSNFSVTSSENSKYGKFSDYADMNPYWKLYDENGNYYDMYVRGSDKTTNPLYNSQFNSFDKTRSQFLSNNFSIEMDLFKDIKLRSKLGISRVDNTSDMFNSPEIAVSSEENDILRKGNYSYTTGNSVNYDFSLTLSYNKLLGEIHQLYAGLDYSISDRKNENYNVDVEGFGNDILNFFGNALFYKENGKPSGNSEQTRRIGFTGNINYTYDNRYYFDASLRLDGSSQFGANNRYALFYSLGLGVNLHREKFMEDCEWVDRLRVKASYGRSGSQSFSPYQALSMYQYYTGDRYMLWNGVNLMGIGNEDLKWQLTDQYNIGLDASFFNDYLNIEADVYLKKTSNLLSQMDLPSANGFSSYVDNVGEVENVGYEISLGTNIIRTDNVFWNVNAKFLYNKTEITKLSDAIKRQNETYKLSGSERSSLLYEGYSPDAIYAVRSLGIDPSTGDEMFLTEKGELTKKWSARDRVYCGVGEAKYRGNITTMFRYKDLSLNLSFAYHFGGQDYNNTLLDKVEVTRGDLKTNLDRRVLYDRWHQVGDVKFFKKIDDVTTKMSSRFVMDDNVFELTNVNLQYRLNNEFLKEHFKISAVNIGVNMNDVFYLSSIKRERGLSYPFARRFSLSMSLLF